MGSLEADIPLKESALLCYLVFFKCDKLHIGACKNK